MRRVKNDLASLSVTNIYFFPFRTSASLIKLQRTSVYFVGNVKLNFGGINKSALNYMLNGIFYVFFLH